MDFSQYQQVEVFIILLTLFLTHPPRNYYTTSILKYTKAMNIAKSYQCILCDKLFRLSSQLRQHFNLTHFDGSDTSPETLNKVLKARVTPRHSYQCQYCPQVFCAIKDLTLHMTIHPEIKSIATQETQLYLKTSRTEAGIDKRLNFYMMVKGKCPYPYKYECSDCFNVFTTSDDLAQHRLVHYQPMSKFPTVDESLDKQKVIPKLYPCNYCYQSFVNIYYLISHELIHVHQMHKCEQCSEISLTYIETKKHKCLNGQVSPLSLRFSQLAEITTSIKRLRTNTNSDNQPMNKRCLQ
jgi:hypothetical protein